MKGKVFIEIPMLSYAPEGPRTCSVTILGPMTEKSAHLWLERNDFKRKTRKGSLWSPNGNYTCLRGPFGWNEINVVTDSVAVIPVLKLRNYSACNAGGDQPERPHKGSKHQSRREA